MYFLGVDLGGTNIAVGLVTENGDLIYKDSTPTLREREINEIIKDIATLCQKVIKDKELDIKEIHSIGIGTPGSCDFDNGVILYSNNIRFDNTPIKAEMKKYIDLPIYIDNDANCAAYGENIKGACKGSKDSITITLGTGVGGGVIVNGGILRGAYGYAAELGHHVIVTNGEYCSCGRNGCWEAYASATALIRDVKKAAIENPDSLINTEVGGDLDKINAKTVFDAQEKGDIVSDKVIDTYLNYVAEGLANMVNIFQPSVIALGGGVANQGEKINEPLRIRVKEKIYGGNLKTEIKSATLGNDAGIIGAALLGK